MTPRHEPVSGGRHRCNVHRDLFDSYEDYYKHAHFHPQHFCCKICDSEFNTASGLRQHEIRAHGDDVDIPCPGCEKVFPRLFFYIKHIEARRCPVIHEEVAAEEQKVKDAWLKVADEAKKNALAGIPFEFSQLKSMPTDPEILGYKLPIPTQYDDDNDSNHSSVLVFFDPPPKSANWASSEELDHLNDGYNDDCEPGGGPEDGLIVFEKKSSETNVVKFEKEKRLDQNPIPPHLRMGKDPEAAELMAKPCLPLTEENLKWKTMLMKGSANPEEAMELAVNPPDPKHRLTLAQIFDYKPDEEEAALRWLFHPDRPGFNMASLFQHGKWRCAWPRCHKEFARQGPLYHHMTDERIHSPVVFICATCNKEFTTRAAVMTHFEPRDSCVIKQVSIRKIPVQQVTNGMIIDTNYDADGTPREPTKTPEQIEAENAAARKVLLERYNRDIKVTDESHALELQRRQDAEDMENNRW